MILFTSYQEEGSANEEASTSLVSTNPPANASARRQRKKYRKKKRIRRGGNRASFSKGTWTTEENHLFLVGLQRFGKWKWKKIGTVIRSRSIVQIKSHGQKIVAKMEGGNNVFAYLNQESTPFREVSESEGEEQGGESLRNSCSSRREDFAGGSLVAQQTQTCKEDMKCSKPRQVIACPSLFMMQARWNTSEKYVITGTLVDHGDAMAALALCALSIHSTDVKFPTSIVS